MENDISQNWVPPVQPQPAQPQPVQPIIQVVMPETKPVAPVQAPPVQAPPSAPVENAELVVENSTLKESNKLYGASLIVLSLIIIAGIAYWIGTFRAPKVVDPDPIDIDIDETYIPTNPDPLFLNNQPGTPPGNSNPEGSDTAPPGGLNVD